MTISESEIDVTRFIFKRMHYRPVLPSDIKTGQEIARVTIKKLYEIKGNVPIIGTDACEVIQLIGEPIIHGPKKKTKMMYFYRFIRPERAFLGITTEEDMLRVLYVPEIPSKYRSIFSANNARYFVKE